MKIIVADISNMGMLRQAITGQDPVLVIGNDDVSQPEPIAITAPPVLTVIDYPTKSGKEARRDRRRAERKKR